MGLKGIMTSAGMKRYDYNGLENIPQNIVREVSRSELQINGNWTTNSNGWAEKKVDCPGTKMNNPAQKVEVSVLGDQIGNVLLAGAKVTQDNTLTLVCLAAPDQPFSLLVIISETM